MSRPRSHDHILLAGGTVLTMDPGHRVIEGDVLVTGGRIVEVGEIADPPPATRLLDTTGCWVLPGLIGSARPEQALLAGRGGDIRHLMGHHDPASLYWSGVVAATNALHSGVTSLVVDSPEAEVTRGLDEIGVRRIEAVPAISDEGLPWESLRTMVRDGVSAPMALASLTRDRARDLGLGDVGSVEPGKAGDLVVMAPPGPAPQTGDPHEDCVARCGRVSVRWVVVDGEIVFAGGDFLRMHPDKLAGEPGRQRAALLKRADA